MTLDHERVDVYRLALDFVVFAHQVLKTLPRGHTRVGCPSFRRDANAHEIAYGHGHGHAYGIKFANMRTGR